VRWYPFDPDAPGLHPRGKPVLIAQQAFAGRPYRIWAFQATVVCEKNSFRLVIDGDTIAEVPRTTSQEVSRYKAYATRPGRRCPPMPDMKLDAADAAELAEMQFLSGWLARDPARLGASLDDFVGHPAYGISQLRQDLERFVFLLGGSDGEPLFGHPPS
jgi:hypothetical protein